MTCKRCTKGEATYCITCMNDIVAETDAALEKAEAEIVKLHAILSCKECQGREWVWKTYPTIVDGQEGKPITLSVDCPVCGPLRQQLKEGGHGQDK